MPSRAPSKTSAVIQRHRLQMIQLQVSGAVVARQVSSSDEEKPVDIFLRRMHGNHSIPAHS